MLLFCVKLGALLWISVRTERRKPPPLKALGNMTARPKLRAQSKHHLLLDLDLDLDLDPALFPGEKMETPREVLLGTLESLGKKELKKFKWCLEGKFLGFPGIPKSELEKADQMDTVDLMLLYYDINTIKVTREVLKKIPRNDLEEKLSETSSDPKGRSLKNGRTITSTWCRVEVPLKAESESLSATFTQETANSVWNEVGPAELSDISGGGVMDEPWLFSTIFSLSAKAGPWWRAEVNTRSEEVNTTYVKCKFHLQEKVLGFPGIPKSRLDKADRMDAVDLMLLFHGIHTIKTPDIPHHLHRGTSTPHGVGVEVPLKAERKRPTVWNEFVLPNCQISQEGESWMNPGCFPQCRPKPKPKLTHLYQSAVDQALRVQTDTWTCSSASSAPPEAEILCFRGGSSEAAASGQSIQESS
ncbi:hypothetical protein F7725_020096, partial [Dissostichus mawsoni]